MTRKEIVKNFPQKTYNKRNRNENVNYVFKNRYGDSLNAYTIKGRRAEIATKIAAYNLWARLRALLHELFNIAQKPALYKISQEINNAIPLAAVDRTGLSRSNASAYYVKRIDRKDPIHKATQVIAFIDVKQRNFI